MAPAVGAAAGAAALSPAAALDADAADSAAMAAAEAATCCWLCCFRCLRPALAVVALLACAQELLDGLRDRRHARPVAAVDQRRPTRSRSRGDEQREEGIEEVAKRACAQLGGGGVVARALHRCI